MAEFYVTFDRDGQHFLAVVTAAHRPATLQFDSRDALVNAMDALDDVWQLTSEVELPDGFPALSAAWLANRTVQSELKQLPQAQGSLFGTFPIAADPGI